MTVWINFGHLLELLFYKNDAPWVSTAFCFVIDFFGNFFAAFLSKQSKAARNGRF